jgi:hypothetical protein
LRFWLALRFDDGLSLRLWLALRLWLTLRFDDGLSLFSLGRRFAQPRCAGHGYWPVLNCGLLNYGLLNCGLLNCGLLNCGLD